MKKSIVALCAVVGLGACGGLDIPDLNNPSLEDFQNAPTRASVISASTGLLMGARVGYAAQNGYVAELGVIGREAFIFDGSDPRYVNELLGSGLDPGGPAFGGNFWTNPYANIRNANTLMNALANLPENAMTQGERQGILGFAKTMQALDFLIVINTRDTNGAPIDVNRPPDSPELAPIVSKEEVFAHISTLLDEAQAHLTAEGAAFVFPLSSGFTDFSSPSSFLRFNRAVKARVSVYRGQYEQALTELSQSFLATTQPLTLGAYHVYGSGSGDTGSGLNSTSIYVHPSIVTDAELQADGVTPDARVGAKVGPARRAGSAADGRLSSNLAFTMYPQATARVPIIRNEELILLRAEANIGLERFAQAADDLNFIRATSGGLAAVAIDGTNALDELLKQKRYSLLFEGGHRWIDLRRYDRLDTLPRELDPNAAPHERFPIPSWETDARQ